MRRISPWIFIIIALLACDQLSKLALRRFLEPGESFSLLIFLRLEHIENRGMAFGMLPDHGGLIIFIGVMVVLVLLVAIMAARDDGDVFWPLAFLVAGSAGNLIDRFARGSVTDFIRFPYWPAFNLADIFIVVGVLLLFRVLLKRAPAN